MIEITRDVCDTSLQYLLVVCGGGRCALNNMKSYKVARLQALATRGSVDDLSHMSGTASWGETSFFNLGVAARSTSDI